MMTGSCEGRESSSDDAAPLPVWSGSIFVSVVKDHPFYNLYHHNYYFDYCCYKYRLVYTYHNQLIYSN